MLGSDSGRLVIVEFNAKKNCFERVHCETYGKTGEHFSCICTDECPYLPPSSLQGQCQMAVHASQPTGYCSSAVVPRILFFSVLFFQASVAP